MNAYTPSFATLAILAIAGTADAAPISFSMSNGDQAATAEITLHTGSVTIKLTNDTAFTSDSNDLLTRFSINIGGMTGGTPTSGTAFAARDIAADGSFLQSGGVDLLALNTWSGAITGETLSFEFHPDAEYGLIGVDTGGDYSGANGSITKSDGHSPFAFGNVTFVFSAAGVTKDSPLSNPQFTFGTAFQTDVPAGPEPASLAFLVVGATGFLTRRSRK